MFLRLKVNHLNEASRRDLLIKSRGQSKNRYRKRLNYQVSNFRGVDLKQLFENDYFVFTTPINDYAVVIAFPGVFTQLRQVVKETQGDPSKINLQMVIRAMRRAFDATDDIRVRCSCADFKYRFMYWANQNDYLYGSPDPGTEEFPKETNPDDMIGATCKHLDLLLSNKRWLVKAASVVNSFIKTYPDKASLYLYDEEDLQDEVEDEIEVDETEVEEVPSEETPEETETTSEVPEVEDKVSDEEEEGDEE